MSYIAFDLDALNVAPAVARAAGVTEDSIIAGLVRLWAWAFRSKTDVATPTIIRGHFGGDVLEALVAFGFLEEEERGRLRIRGAERYLRVAEARRKGGLAARANLRVGPGSSPAAAGEQPRLVPGPYTEHRTPSTEHRTPNDEAPPPPIAAFEVVAPDINRIDSWSKEEFWRATEVTRRSLNYAPEKWPSPLTLAKFWGEARGLGVEVSELAMAFTRFCADKHWARATPPAPFAAFASKWNTYLKPRSPDAA